MIRFRVNELIAEKQFQENRRITIGEIAEACGINRMTLSKICNQRGYNTVTDNIHKLCQYFDCAVEDLMVYVPDVDQEKGVSGESSTVRKRDTPGRHVPSDRQHEAQA